MWVDNKYRCGHVVEVIACEIVKISAGGHGSISDQSFSIKKSLFFALIERFEIGLVIKIVNHFNRLSGTLSFEP